MKKIIYSIAILCSLQLAAQESSPKPNQVGFELGNGINFSLNDGAYAFKISGTLQPYMAFQKMENADEADYFFNSKRTYLNFSGKALEEKVSFFFQMNFSDTDPLLDAWLAYHPWESFTVTIGQKQAITNNRELLIMENKLQFPDRGLLSTQFSRSGRELGIFVENKFEFGNFGFVPQVSVTSGDGKNSFGADSRDVDMGGVKYGGRLDIYPLGFFSEGNDDLVADIKHEQKPKFVIGGAASFNDGASNAVGEGHGDFMLYNGLGEVQLPDYRQAYADILFKFKGFSLLGEYVVATATSLEGSYTDITINDALVPTQISEFLALGSAYNVQVGYVTTNGYALDLRYDQIMPEFESNLNSVISDMDSWTVGVSKYFKENALKVQAAVSSVNSEANGNTLMGQLLFQVTF